LTEVKYAAPVEHSLLTIFKGIKVFDCTESFWQKYKDEGFSSLYFQLTEKKKEVALGGKKSQ
jgi:hypothetical protein